MTEESKYGKEGDPFKLGNDILFINTQFLASTLMAMIVVIRDVIAKDYKAENGMKIDELIEGIATQLYDKITSDN